MSKHLHAEPEYKPRARYGVAACIRKLEDGQIRLILDDVCSESDYWPQTWQSHWPFTHRDFNGDEFLNSNLSQEQLAGIGLWLVARLSALSTNQQQ